MIARAMSAPTPVLVTIPISHFCEKARWALDRAGVAYEEQRHLPALHRVAVRRAASISKKRCIVSSGSNCRADASILSVPRYISRGDEEAS